MYLIIYADKLECPIINWKLIEEGTLKNYKFSKYNYINEDIILVESGVGVVLSGSCTELFCEKFNPSIIFNFGAVGGTQKINKLDLVIPSKIYFHDVITPWYPRGQIPYQPKQFSNNYNTLDKFNLATGMTFLNTKEQVEEIKKSMDVDIFDMEAAAIAQICYKNKVPFIIVKCVSDIIGSDNSNIEDINKYIKLAGEKSFRKVENIIKNIIKS